MSILPSRMSTPRRLSLRLLARWLLAFSFVIAGTIHFFRPDLYLPLMPEVLPAKRFWIFFTGVAEIAGGVGLLVPALRRAATVGIILMLLGFLWVHVDLLFRPATFGGEPIPRWILWARVPFQFVLAAWAWWVGWGRRAAKVDA